jgi:hypothetical protein
MDRDGALPDRCLACNAPAEGYRLKRTLRYSPLAWKIGALIAPFAVLYVGLYTGTQMLFEAFWPLVILLLIFHLVVRKSLKLQIGVCPRHRRLRTTLILVSWLCILAVFGGIFSLQQQGAAGALVLLGAILALFVLVIVQSFVGVQALRLKEISGEHAWISGTGEPFRGNLPELR